jgi:hypothetical protein
VKETNDYAEKRKEEKKVHKRAAKWVTLTTDKLFTFTGMVTYMGVKPISNRKLYWSDAPEWHDAIIAGRMSRSDFQDILRNLHFVSNDLAPDPKSPTYNKLWKVQPLIDVLTESFHTAWVIGIFVSMDEGLLKSRCYLSGILVYMKSKPDKYGIKYWASCDGQKYFCVKFFLHGCEDRRAPRYGA